MSTTITETCTYTINWSINYFNNAQPTVTGHAKGTASATGSTKSDAQQTLINDIHSGTSIGGTVGSFVSHAVYLNGGGGNITNIQYVSYTIIITFND